MSSKRQRETEGEVLQREESDTKEPPMYKVILLNDDYTSMEFVVLILQQVFQKTVRDAHAIMMEVHNNGRGIAGTYTRDIAETKVALVHQLAKQNEFPLRCTIEKA